MPEFHGTGKHSLSTGPTLCGTIVWAAIWSFPLWVTVLLVVFNR